MMQFCFGRERGCQWTLHTEGGGEGGEGRDAKERKKKKERTYPVSEYGRWQHCGKQEGGEDGSLHFGFLFFSFSSLGKLLFLLSLLVEMNR